MRAIFPFLGTNCYNETKAKGKENILSKNNSGFYQNVAEIVLPTLVMMLISIFAILASLRSLYAIRNVRFIKSFTEIRMTYLFLEEKHVWTDENLFVLLPLLVNS